MLKESDSLYFYIKGTLAFKGEGFVVVDNNGIGYRLTVSDNTYSALKAGENVNVYTHLHVREDVMELYGFSAPEEKSLFLMLMGVSGIGAKAAVSILSVGTPSQISAWIITGDAKAIQKAQGIGAKTAQRVILELRDKITADDLNIPADEVQNDSASISEAVGALCALGYSEAEARSALRGVDMSMDTEDIIKTGLKNLVKF